MPNLIPESHSEDAIIDVVQEYLLGLRQGFALLGRHYPVEIGGRSDFELDLLFYHIGLQCYLVIDIRLDAQQSEFAGMLNLYLATVDSQWRTESGPPSIGLLICPDVQGIFSATYFLRDYDTPLSVSGYLAVDTLPGELHDIFPTVDMWQNLLQQINPPGKESITE